MLSYPCGSVERCSSAGVWNQSVFKVTRSYVEFTLEFNRYFGFLPVCLCKNSQDIYFLFSVADVFWSKPEEGGGGGGSSHIMN